MYLKPLIAKDQHFEHGSNIYGIVQLFHPGLWCMCISEKKCLQRKIDVPTRRI